MPNRLPRAWRLVPLVALASVLMTAPVARAQYTWAGTASGNWSAGTNWAGGNAPPAGGGLTTALTFTSVGNQASMTATNDLGAFTVNNLTFDGTASGGFTYASGSGSSLAFGGANAQLNLNQANSNSISWAAAVNSNLTVQGTGVGNFTLAPTAGSGAITVNYAQPTAYMGQFTLNGGAANTFSGGVTVNTGNLVIGSNALALGTGTLTVNGGTVSAGSTQTYANNIALGSDLTLFGTQSFAAGATFAGAISETGGSRGVTLYGTANSLFTTTFQGANTYTGATTLASSPILRATGAAVAANLTLSGGGTIRNTGAINITDGSLLTLDNSATAVQNRLGVSGSGNNGQAALNLNGGLVIQASTGTGATAVSESVGAITAAGGGTATVGASYILLNSGTISGTNWNTPGVALTAASFARQNNAVIVFGANAASTGGTMNPSGLGNGTGFGAAKLTFTDATGLTGALVGGSGATATSVSIIPFALGGSSTSGAGNTLATYDAVSGVRGLLASEYATSISTSAANNDNVYLLNASPTVANGFVNGLVASGTTSYTGLSGTLTIKSGAWLSSLTNASNATTSSSLNVDFNNREAVVTNTTALTINGGLQNYTAFTKSGVGTLTLGTSSASNLTAVPLTINGGLVSFADAAKVNGVSGITVNGNVNAQTSTSYSTPGLEYTGATSATISANINVTAGTARLRSATAGVTTTFSGLISGSGGVHINGGSAVAGTVALTNTANSYTGQTIISYGTLQISGDRVLGNGGAVVLNTSGTIQLTGTDWTTSRIVNGIAAGTIDTNGNNATFNNVVTGTAFTKTGAGSLTLTQQTQMTGTLAVNAGSVYVSNGTTGSALGSAAVTVNSGGTFGGNGQIAGAVTVNGGGTLAAGSASRVGTLTVNNSVNLAPSSGTATLKIGLTGGTATGSPTGIPGTSSGGTVPNPANNTFLDLGTRNSTLTVGGTTRFAIDGTGAGLDPARSYSFAIARAGTLAGFGSGLTDQSLFTASGFNAGDFTLSLTTSNNTVYLNLNFTPVPEPATVLAVGAAGLGALSWLRRRRGRAATTG